MMDDCGAETVAHGDTDADGRVQIHTLECEHGRVFLCAEDLLTWLRRQSCASTGGRVLREKVVTELELMRLHHDLKEL